MSSKMKGKESIEAKRRTARVSFVRLSRVPLARASRVALASCLVLLSLAFAPFRLAHAQQSPRIVDRWVATINGRELITYTDLLWQLALQPNVPLETPRSEDLNRALQLLIDQRLIAQEAEKLPSISPEAQAIEKELAELISRFPSRSDFYQRLARVGLGENSEQLREIVRQRVTIQNYLDFRFRSFTIVTPNEVADYYRDVYVPRRRRQAPGRIVPTLEESRDEIERELTESKIESEIDAFLEESRARAEITILQQV